MIETLRPNADGSETSIPYQYPSSGSHWDKVCEAIADEDDTYIYKRQTTPQRDLYNLPVHSEGSGIINSVTIYCRVRITENYLLNCRVSQKSGGVVTDGALQTTTSTTYVIKSQTYTLNPATGFPYTWDEIDALEIGLVLSTNTGNESVYVRCTQVYAEVDYSPPAGAGSSMAAKLIGAGLL